MKDINPPTRRRPKHSPVQEEKKGNEYWIIRFILALGTIVVIYILSQIK